MLPKSSHFINSKDRDLMCFELAQDTSWTVVSLFMHIDAGWKKLILYRLVKRRHGGGGDKSRNETKRVFYGINTVISPNLEIKVDSEGLGTHINDQTSLLVAGIEFLNRGSKGKRHWARIALQGCAHRENDSAPPHKNICVFDIAIITVITAMLNTQRF